MKRLHQLHHRHILILGLLVLVGLLLVQVNISNEITSITTPVNFGVSFSPEYALSLGIDPRKAYSAILSDLKVKNLRLNAYWDEIEPKKDEYNFKDLNYYIGEASSHQAKVVLAVGYKLPRWPECRAPKWVSQDTMVRQEQQLSMIREVVSYYSKDPTISAFQIENEPTFEFGLCPKPDSAFLKTEVNFVRFLTKKPVILTDAGELSSWVESMQNSDIFGTTLYRVVDAPWFGPFQYPLRPWFYRVKADLIRKFFAPHNQKTIIVELQAEPWADESLIHLNPDLQAKRFSVNQLKEAADFAHKTGFSEVYLWGVEWWYFMQIHGYPQYWQFAKTLF